MAPRCLDLLHVSSQPEHSLLFQMLLRQAGVLHTLHVVPSEAELFAFLDRARTDRTAPCPTLIFMGINAVAGQGLEILERLKAHPVYCRVPVIMLSGPENQHDLSRAYDLKAASVIGLHDDVDRMVDQLQVCSRYWAESVTLPEGWFAPFEGTTQAKWPA